MRTQEGKNLEAFPTKKEKLKVLTVKSTFLRIGSLAFLVPRLVQHDIQSDVRQLGLWVPGGLVTSGGLMSGGYAFESYRD